MTSLVKQKPFEILSIDGLETYCDGGGGSLGHPKVYLRIRDGEDHVVCPYCSRMFVTKHTAQKLES